MLTFWRHGYETTSIVDLTSAMGVTAPSLYGAFGDKKRLFLEAMRLYVGDPEAMANGIQSAPSAYDAARSLLTNAAVTYTGDATPRGCLLASAAASGSAQASDVQEAVGDIRRSMAASLEARIRSDMSSGNLSADTDAVALSGFVIAVAQGMSVLARDGASRVSLLAIVDTAMAAWPQN